MKTIAVRVLHDGGKNTKEVNLSTVRWDDVEFPQFARLEVETSDGTKIWIKETREGRVEIMVHGHGRTAILPTVSNVFEITKVK